MKSLFSLLTATLGLIAVLALSVVNAPTVSAAKHTGCSGGVQTAYFGCIQQNRNSSNLADNPVYKLLLEVVKFLGAGVGIVVVGGIAYGSFLIVNSNANAGQTQQGVSIITNAVIGLILYIFLFAIINYLVPGGLFA